MSSNRFYIAAALIVGALLVNATVRTFQSWNRQEEVDLLKYERLSPQECIARFRMVQKSLSSKPKTPEEYFNNLDQAYRLIGSANRLMNPDFRMAYSSQEDFAVRSIPISVHNLIDDYSKSLVDFPDADAIIRARDKYEATSITSLRNTKGSEFLAESAIWWLIFHLCSIPFIFVHYAIGLRKRGCKVWLEVVTNPLFLTWLYFWEIGVFRYPKKISPLQQLRRAKQWAAFVFCSTVSCFAGQGKICDKVERTPQHQKYDGPSVSGSTETLSEYLGLDGAVFHPYPVQQSSLTVATNASGLYGNLWFSLPLGGYKLQPNFGREVDLTAGWIRSLGACSVDLSSTYFAVDPLLQIPRGDLLQFSATLSRTFSPAGNVHISPYIWTRRVFPLKGGRPVGGTFIHWGAKLNKQLSKRMTANVDLQGVHDSGAFGFHSGFIGRVLSDITWSTKKGVSVHFPILRFSSPLSPTHDGRGPELSYGFGLSFVQTN